MSHVFLTTEESTPESFINEYGAEIVLGVLECTNKNEKRYVENDLTQKYYEYTCQFNCC